MKKIILSAVVLFTVGFASAQDKKEATGEGFSNGDVFVSGSVGFGSTKNKNTNAKTNSFELVPQIGLFVSDNIAVGIKLGYSSAKVESGSTTTSEQTGFTAGAFGRYYFTPASKFSLFGQLGFDYTSVTVKIPTPQYKDNTTNVNLGLGLNYFVSNNFSLETGLGLLNFGSSKTDISGDKGSSNFSLGGNWTALTIGVNYKF